jgi:hypothetical protein
MPFQAKVPDSGLLRKRGRLKRRRRRKQSEETA